AWPCCRGGAVPPTGHQSRGATAGVLRGSSPLLDGERSGTARTWRGAHRCGGRASGVAQCDADTSGLLLSEHDEQHEACAAFRPTTADCRPAVGTCGRGKLRAASPTVARPGDSRKRRAVPHPNLAILELSTD